MFECWCVAPPAVHPTFRSLNRRISLALRIASAAYAGETTVRSQGGICMHRCYRVTPTMRNNLISANRATVTTLFDVSHFAFCPRCVRFPDENAGTFVRNPALLRSERSFPSDTQALRKAPAGLGRKRCGGTGASRSISSGRPRVPACGPDPSRLVIASVFCVPNLRCSAREIPSRTWRTWFRGISCSPRPTVCWATLPEPRLC